MNASSVDQKHKFLSKLWPWITCFRKTFFSRNLNELKTSIETERLPDRNPIPIVPYPYTVHSPFPLVLSGKELNYPFKMYIANQVGVREEEE